MKYIFDFDDVLLHTSKQRDRYILKEYQFDVIEKAGIPRDKILEYYNKERLNQFSLKKMLAHFSLDESLYEEIVSNIENFVNKEMLDVVKKLERANCIILTYGDVEFQRDKVRRSGIEKLFSEIIAVEGGKKEAVEKICAKYKDEQVIFIDDAPRHLENLDFKKYPNLKTILYTGQDLKSILDF